jgi:hypothetical protein
MMTVLIHSPYGWPFIFASMSCYIPHTPDTSSVLAIEERRTVSYQYLIDLEELPRVLPNKGRRQFRDTRPDVCATTDSSSSCESRYSL